MKKVLIIFGGNSSEHYVSCKSAKSIIENIDNNLFDYEMVGIDFNNDWYKFKDELSYLEKGNWKSANVLKIDNIISYIKTFDVVFPIIHGKSGEDGTLQGMFELFDIKFVGCNTISSAIGMDKEMAKKMFDNLKIEQVPYVVILGNYKINDITDKIEFPMIVKPANGGSSIGITKVENKKQLKKAIEIAKKYDKKIIIEKFIKCRELECAILENENGIICSRPGEIKSANEFYDYDSKYVNDKSYTIIPDDIPKDILNRIKELAFKIFLGLKCRDYARIDFFYDESNNIYINEINTIPGFTTISMYPKLIESENISYKELITILINNAYKREY